MLRPRRFGRLRLAAFAACERAAVLAGGRGHYRRRYLSPSRLALRSERVAVQGLPAALDGFRLAHLSDVHAGPFLGSGDLAGVADLVAREAPDVVCWTGDYATHRIEDALAVADDLARITGRLGTFAVFGNHDYFQRRESELVTALEPAGWRFLRNEGVVVDVDGARVGVAGIEDPEEGKAVRPDAAMAGASPADVVVALAHGPRAAPAFAELGARVVLAGHTHGRQVDLPLLRHIGPAHPGLRVELGHTTLLVTRGLGAIGLPLRRRAPAEIVVATLRPS